MDSHTITVNPQETSIKKIDEQIQTLRDYLQKLCVARNALLPINRLPPEILLDIFAFVAKGWTTRGNLLNLTWVSHNWRDLALGSPTLWTDISEQNLTVVEEWLARSGSAPLSIGLFNVRREFVQRATPKLQAIFIQMHRIKTFHYCRADVEAFELSVAGSIWEEPVPLVSLKLEGVFLEGCFLPSVPDVRNLLLLKCRFSWEAGTTIFLRLTSLHIAFPRSTTSVSQFLGLIQQTPSLQRLVAIDVFSSDGDQVSFTPSPTLQFPRLHILKLGFGEAIQPSLEFLKNALSSFTTDQTIISCSFDATQPINHHLLAHLLPSFSQVVSPEQVLTIRTENWSNRMLETGFSTLFIGFGDIEQESCRMNLQIEINRSQHNTLHSILQEGLSLVHVQAIKFSYITSHFLKVFARLPNVRHVQVQAVHLPHINEIIFPVDDETLPPPFASLKILGSTRAESRRIYQHVAEVLVKRQRLGYGLDTMILKKVTYDNWEEDALDGLRDMVDHVVWEDSPEMSEIESVFQGVEPVLSDSSAGLFGDD
ncbi:hypothetical protein BDN72DRAFT_850952 [Pluteus cervinus]|uniref:Uncharacterized protein n=1 Tax=Pluteus cervinus TaxID=181527 RepID=A0ACD3A2T5_9AGAR|nr:hypothetical protein BDN72DRAFT_850952 [Pluteus cervinus]